MTSRSVFLLWHTIDPGDDDLTKLLGVYSTREGAHDRIASASPVAGFADFPDGFLVDEYILDEDKWTEGFELIAPDDWVAPDSTSPRTSDPFNQPDP